MYEHNAKYYETDQMAIVHHSNYIRWMEEARMDFMDKHGYDCARMEKEGLVMPIVEVSCRYESMTKFNDTVCIEVQVIAYSKAKVTLGYVMTDKKTGQVRARGSSVNCFMKEGRVRALPRICPELDEVLTALSKAEKA